jgi:hypothetical protein
MSPRARWFGVGVGLGLVVGVLAAALGTPGIILLIVASLWAAAVPPRFAFLSGLLISAGVAWSVIGARFAAICDQAPGSCSGPPIWPFLAFAVATVVLGLGLAVGTKLGAGSRA